MDHSTTDHELLCAPDAGKGEHLGPILKPLHREGWVCEA
jgi:hypothetical protein